MGRFSLRFDYNSEAAVKQYISNLYRGIVSKDITAKFRSEDRQKFTDISLYILANAGKEFSSDNLVNAYKTEKKVISQRTVYNYLDRMKKPILFMELDDTTLPGKRHSETERSFTQLILH